MTKVLDIQEMANFIEGLRSPIARGSNLALIETTQNALAEAKRNVLKNFKGSPDRPKTGQLSEAIFAGFEKESKDFASSFIGVSSKKGEEGTKPYGRIHEFGGKIKNKRANWLWIPLFGPKSGGVTGKYRNMTPTDFVKLMQAGRAFLVPTKKGLGWVAFANSNEGAEPVNATLSSDKTKVPLFVLRKEVTIPARPYVTPAVESEFKKLPERLDKRIKEQLEKE